MLVSAGLGWPRGSFFLFFQHLSLRSSLTSASLLHFLVDWLISLAVTLVLKKRVNGRISAVLSPIWLKFWPKVGLASLLDCYSMKKSGCLLKKRSFRRFPSLLGIRAQSGVFVQRCLVRQPYLGRFMPALAQILGAGSPDPSPDLLFNATKR